MVNVLLTLVIDRPASSVHFTLTLPVLAEQLEISTTLAPLDLTPYGLITFGIHGEPLTF